MKKKLLVTLLTMCMAASCMTGCGDKPTYESSGIEAQRPEETTEDAAAETTTEVVMVPTKFEIFTDGEPHYVMYHADLEYTYWDTFTSMSKPEAGIESVSFLSEIIDYEGEMRKFDSNDHINLNGDMLTPVDATSLSNIEDDGFAVYVPAVGLCGIINREFEYAGDVPTIEEVSAFVKGYGLGSWDELYAEMSEDGELMYCSYFRTYLTEGNYYYGGYAFRVKDGVAQGAYAAVYGEDIDDGIGIFRYMMQSLRFTE